MNLSLSALKVCWVTDELHLVKVEKTTSGEVVNT